MVTCPTCGREDFKNERGMQLHHARMHNESLATETRECAWCGDDVEVRPSRRGKNKRVFCSGSDCYAKWQSENRSGEDSPTWKGRTVTTDCVVCGQEKEIRADHVEKFDVHFCSTECESEYKTGKRTGSDNPQWTERVTVSCEWCGNDFERPRWHAENGHRNFCDKECADEWTSENWVGENNPLWEGGYHGYGPGWNDAKKRKVRKRDDHTCQHPACTVTNEQHKEVYEMALHVHHIQNHRQFDSAEERNAMSNLVALCLPHHKLWEQISPLTPSNYAD